MQLKLRRGEWNENPPRRGMGSIDIEVERDFRESKFSPDLSVYEDTNLKNRPIGFIWPSEKLIVTK